MAWIKRNLSLVISGLVALGLLGFGGFYLWQSMGKNQQVDNEILQTKSEIERLLNKDVTPSPSNLNNAKRELERLNAFITEAKKQFPPSPPPPDPLTSQSFKSLLQNTINELHKQANLVNIKVETNYFFTFKEEELPVVFPQESLRPLTERLHEVRVLAEILFNARINRLEGMKRAPVPGEKGATPGDFLGTPVRFNAETGLAAWPYELTFQCFTSELGAVLEALQKVSYGFVVKSVSVQPAEEVVRVPQRVDQPGRPGGRGGAVTNAPQTGLVTVINEKLLRVTLRLEVLKPAR